MESDWTVPVWRISKTALGEMFGRPIAPGFLVGMAAKRLLDIVGAVAGLVLLAPLLALIAFLIRRDAPGPALFRQRRYGLHGQVFEIWKFRTMYVDAEARVAELEARNQAAGGLLFKIEDDPRVTSIGRFLRRTNLDELPQLLNVLRGEMSLVGPRPFQIRDSDKIRATDPAAFARRLDLPPGVTGAWQVGRKTPVDSEHLLDFDLDYVENWSLARDLKLIALTVMMIFRDLIRR